MTRNFKLSSSQSRRRFARQRRSGAVTIEFLVVLPVLLLSLLAAVQFGYYFQRVDQVMLASRIGAEQASQTLGLPASGAVPTNIADTINRQLASSGIVTAAIIVEHNTTGPEQTLRTNYLPNSIPEPTSPLPASCVRVTVCVPLTSLMPNALANFGFDVSTRFGVQTTTFGYEL